MTDEHKLMIERLQAMDLQTCREAAAMIALLAAGASEGHADFEEWFAREQSIYPHTTQEMTMMRRAWHARDTEIATLRERIAGMEKDAIRRLIAQHAEVLEQNDYAYFELAYTRRTGWMAWICSNHRDDDPNRKVIARGQGDTPDDACVAANRS